MNEILFMVLAFMAGIILGIIFFYGLWLTAIILIGFYYISQGNWQRLLVCLLGFITARHIVKRFTSQKKESQLQLKKEVSHES
jgi:hypothetical protein